ncbi:hypothetical protein ACJMK2_037974 [Sinanodonta woodiana]|uniref:HTH CENPB-type domain-containing protein n=1 Tax=Sinanodonta woodiana TaxID=1069815 RepID=A0ABD3WQJ2_SINWO
MNSRKCKSLTLAQRFEVIKCAENNTSRASNNNNPSQKRKRGGASEDVKEALLKWFAQARSRQIPIYGLLLLEKTNQLANGSGLHDFNATNGWLERCKTRNGIQFKRQHDKKQDADDSGSERWITDVLPEILKDHQPKDIFNADENWLY